MSHTHTVLSEKAKGTEDTVDLVDSIAPNHTSAPEVRFSPHTTTINTMAMIALYSAVVRPNHCVSKASGLISDDADFKHPP